MIVGAFSRAVALAAVVRVPLPRVAHVRLECTTCGFGDDSPAGKSVSGVLYSAPEDAPTVRLFTKAGCTLCDVAKGVLADAAAARPHTLEAVDITDPEHAAWYEKYKYDIPVLHIDGKYWAKHRITIEESLDALQAASENSFEVQGGEPDSSTLN